MTLTEQERIELMVAAYDRASADDRVGRILRAAIGHAEAGEIDAALQRASEALRACPGYPDAAALLGALLQARGQRETAAVHYRAATQYDPLHPLALWHVAWEEAASGETEAARQKLGALSQTGDPIALAGLAGLLRWMGHVKEAATIDTVLCRRDPDWAALVEFSRPAEDGARESPWQSSRQAGQMPGLAAAAAVACGAVESPPTAPWAGGAESLDVIRQTFGERIAGQYRSDFLRRIVAPDLLRRVRGAPEAAAWGLGPAPGEHPDMVLVPSGEYIVGSEEKALKHPRQKVELATPLLIDRYPVTNQQWREFDPSHAFPSGAENFPVVLVDAVQAELYARSCGKRLPTETEWEIAARGPQGEAWPWGGAPSATACNCAETTSGGLSNVTEHPDGASFCGAQDMSGNVQEWTASWLVNKAQCLRITKGGDFSQPMTAARPEMRGASAPTERRPQVGFRCVRDW